MEHYSVYMKDNWLSSLPEYKIQFILNMSKIAFKTDRKRLIPNPIENIQIIYNEIITDSDLDIFFTKIDNIKNLITDIDIFNILNLTEVKILYFLIFTNKFSFNRIKKTNYTDFWEIETGIDYKGGLILYHSTNSHSMYSILRNGLKIMSNTNFQINGAADGPGIYLADNFDSSSIYGNGYTLLVECLKPNKQIFSQNYVQEEKDLILRGFIYYESQYYDKIKDDLRLCEAYITRAKLNEPNNDENVLNSKRFRLEISNLTSKKLDNVLSIYFENNNPRNRLVVEFIPPSDSKLYEDCIKYNVPFIKIAFYFVNEEGNKGNVYPFSPPLVRIVSPIFKEKTGRVSIGGSICLNLLYNSSWSPACNIESIIKSIISVIPYESQDYYSQDSCGRIDETKLGQEYSFENFLNAYKNTKIIHGW